MEVRIFHPVALAGFQIVSIHVAVELDWAHGRKTIPGPLNWHNKSAAVSRASRAHRRVK